MIDSSMIMVAQNLSDEKFNKIPKKLLDLDQLAF
jgi:hypothetical protein